MSDVVLQVLHSHGPQIFVSEGDGLSGQEMGVTRSSFW